MPTKTDKIELPIVSFKTAKLWERWLASNHSKSPGVWLCIQKKGSEQPSVTYAEALESALCYGWIDGQKATHDETSWLQRFTPRRAKSGWSKINIEHAERLIKDGRMKPPGLAQIEAAKCDQRWAAAYDSQSKATIPDDFLQALRRDKSALAFFQTLNRANHYAIAYRLQTASGPALRKKRMTTILEKMRNGEKFHERARITPTTQPQPKK